MRKTKFIAFTSQKGGVGKSTFNIMVASCFHFLARQEVVLIDRDQPQSNVYKLRQQEIEELKNDEEKRADFQAQERPSYGVYNASLPETLELMKQLNGKVDMVFIDMPGTLNNPALPPIWAMLDYIFMPMHGDPFSVTATEGFVKIIREFIQKIPGNRLKGYYAFWNQRKKSVKQEYFQEVEEYFKEEQIPMLKTKVEDSVVYTRRDMRSTMFPPNKQNSKIGLIPLLQEITVIIFEQETAASKPEEIVEQLNNG